MGRDDGDPREARFDARRPLLGEEGRRRDVLDEVGQFPLGVVCALRRVHAGNVRERSEFRPRGELFSSEVSPSRHFFHSGVCEKGEAPIPPFIAN